ncbi:MAG: hypothetical protein MZV64_13675 [Ignavibacteriales bacterium]|nr:hypothetical protein [Ignavibacteriales bacterium]
MNGVRRQSSRTSQLVFSGGRPGRLHLGDHDARARRRDLHRHTFGIGGLETGDIVTIKVEGVGS